tara:strand:+ start:1126 stop:1485 length:360 start_codon:yes stop_codon:yes gene_type:complete
VSDTDQPKKAPSINLLDPMGARSRLEFWTGYIKNQNAIDKEVKDSIGDIEDGMRIYYRHGEDRLDSVLWRVCDGLGGLLKHLVKSGDHDGKKYWTGKGYSIEMSDKRFDEAMKSRGGEL